MAARKKATRKRTRAGARVQTSPEPPTAPVVTAAPQRPPKGERVFARRPFGYGPGPEKEMLEVFELAGLPHDERLMRLGYVEKFTGKTTYRCRVTGREFATESAREQAGRRRDRLAKLNEKQLDRALESEAKYLEEAEPLYLDQTAASRA